jgi:PmbA protein
MDKIDELNEFISIAKRLGADASEFFSSEEESLLLSSQGKDIKTKEFSVDAGYSVRVLRNGRVGFAPFRKKQDCSRAVKNALALSKLSPVSDFSFAPKQKYPRAATFDPSIASLDERDALSMLGSILDSCSKHGSRPLESYFSCSSGTACIANSNGLSASQRSTALFATANSGFKNSSGGESFACRRFGKKEEESVRSIGEKAALYAKQMSGAGKLPSQTATLAFERESLLSLLGSTLMPSFSGEKARRNLSALCNKEGKQIADSRLSLTDDSLASALALSSFDGEGVRSSQIQLIEKGIFRNFLFDRLNSSLAGRKAQGSCSRSGYLSAPSVGGSNLVLSFPHSEPGKYLLVRSILGEHTANTTTGDLSFSVEGFSSSGKPFRGNLVVANIFKLLNGIEGAGKETQAHFNLISPRIYFGDVQVVG